MRHAVVIKGIEQDNNYLLALQFVLPGYDIRAGVGNRRPGCRQSSPPGRAIRGCFILWVHMHFPGLCMQFSRG